MKQCVCHEQLARPPTLIDALRRMRFTQSQQCAAHVDGADTVQLQPRYCGPADRCKRHDTKEIIAPLKMIAPVVEARMEERNSLQSFWIDSHSIVLFAIVAIMTREREVCQVLVSRICNGINVVYCKCIERERFRRPAILTSVISSLGNLTSKAQRNALSKLYARSECCYRVNTELFHKLAYRNCAQLG